jgi:hypothetical protein
MARPFDEDEFLLLSRRGSVGPGIRSKPRDHVLVPEHGPVRRASRTAREERPLPIRLWRRVQELRLQ